MRRGYRPPRQGEILAYVSTRGMKATPEEHQSGPHLRISPAPCCQHKKRGGSLVINTKSGLWTCFFCDSRGNWITFCRAVGDPVPDPYEDERPFTPMPMQIHPRRPVSGGHHKELLDLCLARGFTTDTLNAWRVSTKGPENLRWPLYGLIDGQWKPINSRIRRVINRDEKETTADWFEFRGGPKTAIGNHLLGTIPYAWGARWPSFAKDWLDLDAPPIPGLPPELARVKKILICEGQWDAMTAYQLGIPALSLPNGAASIDVQNLLRYVPEKTEVWVSMDQDTAGQRALEAFYAQLGASVVPLFLPYKDLNEWLQKEPKLTAEQVLRARTPPKRVTASGNGSTEKKIRSLAEIETSGDYVVPGLVTITPWPRLTKRLGGGLYECEVTSLLAPSGIGKTTIANELLLYAALNDVRVGVIQLEGDRGKVTRAFVNQLKGRVDYDDMEQQHFEAAKRNIIFSDLEGKATTCAQTLDEAEQMMRDGCRLVAIDNWDFITSDTEQGTWTKSKAFGKFQTLCKQYHAHGIAVWQPHKVDRTAEVNSGSQKGLSSVLQDSDVYLSLNKLGILRKLEVEKARTVETDDMTSTIWLRYERDVNCMIEIDSDAQLNEVNKKHDKPWEHGTDGP